MQAKKETDMLAHIARSNDPEKLDVNQIIHILMPGENVSVCVSACAYHDFIYIRFSNRRCTHVRAGIAHNT